MVWHWRLIVGIELKFAIAIKELRARRFSGTVRISVPFSRGCLPPMSSLADLPELIGFFSYSREDDEDAHGTLSALRERIQRELRGQLGRSMKTFRLWQDKEAIPSGTLWETEIKNAIVQSVFFIPIITPTVVRSPYCRFELEAFLAREAALGRSDLVFPILYIKVPELEDGARRKDDPVLSIIAKRQYLDWREFRHRDVHSTDVKEAVERFCAHICEALERSWLSPEQRKQQDAAAALERAEAERKSQEIEARRREEEARKKAAEVVARERTDEERSRREAEAEQKRAEELRLRHEAEARRQAEEDERRRLRRSEARPHWSPSRPALMAGLLIGLAVLGAIGVWLVFVGPTPVSAPAPAPVAQAPVPTPAPTTPAPVPVAPTKVSNAPLSPEQERALKPKDTFKECTNCPEMIVVPAGSFTMGSPANEQGRHSDESPQHTVTFARQFAVGRFALTFDEWDACVADDGCSGYKPSDQGWGRGRRPVINVSRDEATAFMAWLSRKTGKPYRLLTEAEWEYAARAGTTTAYYWGDDIGKGNANCDGCGSQWDAKQTSPVGSFKPNAFGLYDMAGNVLQWVQDCYHTYNGAPTDGSAWTSEDCSSFVVRGGSWLDDPRDLRAAKRGGIATFTRGPILGFRVGRTLLAP